MKNNQTKIAAALLLVAGSIIPAYGQGRGHERGEGRSDNRPQPPQQQRGQGQDRQAWRQESRPQFQPPQQQESFRQSRAAYQPEPQNFRQPRAYQPQEQQQDFRNYRQQQNFRPQANYRDGRPNQQFGFRDRDNDRRTWSDRGDYRGAYRGYIPQNRFYGSFGRDHYFRIGRPAFYNGYPRFQYGGYSFRIVDQWPDYWGPDWYDSDDVYIDYENDGYYMYNRRYPGPGISLSVDF
ncbi:MAG TPA: hypothetical protein VNH18_31795 [Bryobacteraceae bacterium]|nr:hypothetical protein [Bryobacteraceae bacterium]